MNDPEPRSTSDGFDHDAMFADIVAHWNEAAEEPTAVLRPASKEAPNTPPSHMPPGDMPRSDDEPSDAVPRRGESAAPGVIDDQTDAETRPEAIADATDDRTPFHENALDPTWTRPQPSPPPAIPAPQAWRAHEVDDDDEEHFEPAPVAPLPVGDLQFWAIIIGLGGGPLLLLYLTLFNREASDYWMMTAIAMSVGGFGLLVARLPRDHDDDGDDNGARL